MTLDVERLSFGASMFGAYITGLRGPLVALAVRDSSTRVVRLLLPGQVYVKDVLALAKPGVEVLVLDGVPPVGEWKRIDTIARAAALAKTEPKPCGCTVDSELGAGPVCPACGHRDHGRGGCREEAQS